MAVSMTSFGQGRAQSQGWLCDVRLSSVNSRFLEIHLHLPRALEASQGELRKLIQEIIFRGKVSLKIAYAQEESPGHQLTLNEEAVASYVKDLERISGCSRNEMTLESFLEIIKMPDAYDKSGERVPQDVALALASEALLTALEMHRTGAQREGEALVSAMRSDLHILVESLEAIRACLPDLEKAYRERLETRLNREIDSGQWDENRLTQEILLFVDKTDIAEELVRLDTHCQGLVRLLDDASPRPLGKEMDFFLQEMNREVNTIGSKIQDPDITPRVVEMKKRIEQCREQVQNLA